jgi:hypothetical protein
VINFTGVGEIIAVVNRWRVHVHIDGESETLWSFFSFSGNQVPVVPALKQVIFGYVT